jgi:hypothetical protein
MLVLQDAHPHFEHQHSAAAARERYESRSFHALHTREGNGRLLSRGYAAARTHLLRAALSAGSGCGWSKRKAQLMQPESMQAPIPSPHVELAPTPGTGVVVVRYRDKISIRLP